MDKKNITIISVALVVGIIGFFGGMQYQKHKDSVITAANTAARAQRTGGFGGRMGGMMRGGGGVIGEVLSKDDKSITVKTTDGGSKIVFFSTATTISKSAQGTISDVSTGSQVFVSGTTNADGSVTAQNIQLRPAMPVGIK